MEALPPVVVVFDDDPEWHVLLRLPASRQHEAAGLAARRRGRGASGAACCAPAISLRRRRRTRAFGCCANARRSAITRCRCAMAARRSPAAPSSLRRARCYEPAGAAGRGPRLGRRGAALRAAFRAQLGHRRLHRPGDRWSSCGAGTAPASSASTRCTRCSRTTRRTRARTARRAACSSTCCTSTSRRSTTSPSATKPARWSPARRIQARLAALRAADMVDHGRCRQGQAGRARAAVSALSPPASRARQRARASLRRLSRAPRQRAASPCVVRGAAGAFPSRRRVGVGLAGVADGVSRSRRRRQVAAFEREQREARRVLRVPAMAGRRCSSARWAGAAWRLGPGRRPVRRSRGVGRPRRRRSLGACSRCTRSARRSARRPTSCNLKGQNWGLPPLDPARLRAAALRAVHRDAARQHAPRRRAAHRPRDGR